ncbi:MAG: hypothetical protein JNL74_12075, partial [Fibrobacteres bacterium]|nr:hypothetical protein [Fibrobacterota bacterium]
GIVTFDASGAAGARVVKTIDVNGGRLALKSLRLCNTSSNTDTVSYKLAAGDTLGLTGNFSMGGSANGLVYADTAANTNCIEVSDSLFLYANARGGTIKLKVNGNSTQYYKSSGIGVTDGQALLPDLEIATTGSLLPATGTTKIGSSALYLRSGTFTAPTDTFAIGRVDQTRNDTVIKMVAGSVFNHNSGTVTFVGSAAPGGTATKYIDLPDTMVMNNVWFYNASLSNGIVIYHTGTAREDTLVANGNLRVSAKVASIVKAYKGVYRVRGNVTNVTGAAAYSTGDTSLCAKLIMSGTGTQNYCDSLGGGGMFFTSNLIIRKPANSKVVATGSVWSMSSGASNNQGQQLHVESGVLDMNGVSLTTRGKTVIAGTLILRGGAGMSVCTTEVASTGALIHKGSGGMIPIKGKVVNDGFIYFNSNGRLSGDVDSMYLRIGGNTAPPRHWYGSGTSWLVDLRIGAQYYDAGTINVRSCKDTLDEYGGNIVGNTGFSFSYIDTVRYSIGTNTGVIYGTGTATTNRSVTVTFAGATLPSNVGEGDMIIFDPNNSTFLGADTCWIKSRDNTGQVTLQLPPVYAYSGEDYEIKRAYNTLQAWEDAAPTDLVAQNVVWKGVCYNDGIFTSGVMLSGSTTDATHFMWLTAASGARHNGKAYSSSGIRIENSTDYSSSIDVRDYYTRISWLQIKRVGQGSSGINTTGGTGGSNSVFENCILYSPSILVPTYGAYLWQSRMSNCLVYGAGWTIGIQDASSAKIYNNTVYNCGKGITSQSTSPTVKNNISVGCATADFSPESYSFSAQSSTNISSMAYVPGTGSLGLISPKALFVDTASATLDLSLRNNSPAKNRGDSTAISQYLTKDINDTLRAYGNWDIGAVENVTIDTVIRSIGMQAASLYTAAGTASTNSIGDTITISSGSFPDSIGEGDSVIIGADSGAYIRSRVSATQLVLQVPISFSQSAKDIKIFRRYNTLQAWEDDRDGNLTARNTMEKGVCYRDAPFTAQLSLEGWTTDANRSVLLTSATNQRHRGIAGSGVKIQTTGTNAIQIGSNQHYMKFEWLELVVTGAGEAIHGDQGYNNNDNLIFGNLIVNGGG